MSDYITNGVNNNLLANCFVMFKHEIETLNVTPGNISQVLSLAMKVAEKSEAKGEDQKYLAKELVRKVVSQLEEGDEKTLLLSMIDNNILEDMIETIVLASKGKLPINQIVKKAKRSCYDFFKLQKK